MINLSDSPTGFKRVLKIEGINSWTGNALNITFKIEIRDVNDNLIDDKAIDQNRRVVYNLNNQNFVDAQFNPVSEGTEGAKGEYQFFFERLSNTYLLVLIEQLANKLNQRNLFD